MTDEVTASTAAPEPVAATPEPVAQPTPEVARPAAEPAKVEKPAFEPTPRGAVERAIAKLNGEKERSPDGRFVGKDGAPPQVKPQTEVKPTVEQAKPAEPAPDALPERFKSDPAASAAWVNADPALKGAMNRTIRELEGGITKYRADAEAFDAIRDFDELAKRSGTDIRSAMENYVGIESMLRQDPIAGLDRICSNLKLSLVDVARHIVAAVDAQEEGGGEPEDPRIQALQREIAALKGQVGTVNETFTEQRKQGYLGQIQEFAARTENKRWAELEPDILAILKGEGDVMVPPKFKGMDRVTEAYRLASLLRPAPAAPVITAPAVTSPDPVAQTHRGSLSVTGAPGTRNGSDPANRKPASSIRESIRNARAAIG
jgi:hypothetical protein